MLSLRDPPRFEGFGVDRASAFGGGRVDQRGADGPRILPRSDDENAVAHIATTEFIEGATAQAKSLGIDPALVFIPHPVQDRTDDELRKLADDHLEPILAMLLKG